MPPRKDRPVCFELPKMIESKDAVSALAAIVGAVAASELTPAEAAELSKVVDGYTRALWQPNWGEYARAFEGAYFARQLEQARQEHRICRVAVDPILPVKAFFDIGGAGHSSDAMAIWIAQFVGREIRLLDYIEGVGQPLAYYAHELRRRDWKDVIVYLPHDGVATNNITGKRYIDHWIEAGFDCGTPIKNTGAGAAMMRIEAARRVFPRCWFNGSTTEAGRDALGYYHERQDEKRSIGLGPDHDWSSHAADAFGYMAIAYEEPPVKSAAFRRPPPPRMGTHWSD